MNSTIFTNELKTIKDENIKGFAQILLDNAPKYFYIVPASSTGKYHPSYSLGEGGLVRHTKATLKFLNYMLSIEQYDNLFTDMQKDCMRVACLYHDAHKQGDSKSNFTVFEHPLIAANAVRKYKGEVTFFLLEGIELIAQCIETHMGEFCIAQKSHAILPKPVSEVQKLVHLADYLASRKDIEVLFDGHTVEQSPKETIDTYIMSFGKYKGMLLTDIAKKDAGYLRWLKDNTTLKNPLKNFVDELLKGA